MRKLAEYGQDEGLDVYNELTPYITELADSKCVSDAIKAVRNKPESERSTTAAGREFIVGLFRAAIQEKRDATRHIIAILNDMAYDEAQKQSAPWFVRQSKDLMSDPDLMSFFTSFVDIQGRE